MSFDLSHMDLREVVAWHLDRFSGGRTAVAEVVAIDTLHLTMKKVRDIGSRRLGQYPLDLSLVM